MHAQSKTGKEEKYKKEWLETRKAKRERPYESKKENRMKQAEESIPLWKDILSLFIKMGILALLFLAIFTFVFGLFRNQDADMYPNIKDGDLVVYYRLDKDYIARDLLVLDYQGNRQVRRVVAVAGDTVDITEDGLLVNGSPQQEPGIYEETERYVCNASGRRSICPGRCQGRCHRQPDLWHCQSRGYSGKSNDRDPAKRILTGYSYIPLPTSRLCGRNLKNYLKIPRWGYRGDK